MNGYILASLAILGIANLAEATFLYATVGTGATALTLSGGSAALGLLGAVIILKSLVFGAALGARRGKRSAEEDSDAAFAVLASSEPAQCYRRLICDLAAGAIPDTDNIITLFNKDVSVVSPKFEYVTAAKVGKIVKQSQICEIRYSCPLNTQEIQKLFA